jgi:anthranilate phosphoribosyltransferase
MMDWFGSKIQRLINKEDLDRDTIRKMFTQVLRGEQPDLQQGAFLAALVAKGETAAEIAGAWEAIREVDTVKVEPEVEGPILDNCGTGMDPFKTFNIRCGLGPARSKIHYLQVRHGGCGRGPGG